MALTTGQADQDNVASFQSLVQLKRLTGLAKHRAHQRILDEATKPAHRTAELLVELFGL